VQGRKRGASLDGAAGHYTRAALAVARLASWLVFLLLMAVILPASLAVIVCLYLPWVALRAV
jgi:hypothetical protein